MPYRVEELAEAAGISVELIRSYQSKGLLAAPRHEGRVAHYEAHHLDRLRAIRELKEQGYSLRAIARVLDPAVADVSEDDAPEEVLTQRELAERTRVPPAFLRSLEASGILRPRHLGGTEPQYTGSDVRAVRMLLRLIGDGLPMEEFMRVAKVQLEAVDTVAREAVDLFMRYVREPLMSSGLGARDEGDQLVAAFREMLHATTSLMAYNFQRSVLNAALDELERTGSKSEKAALRRESGRRNLEVVMPT
ncbi:MAG TPA: MerR family transcriptional regulator [Acidimicrobiales bacterium]|nr:MerR family transcriptional regulator [Acidimicrobiales bacterium]